MRRYSSGVMPDDPSDDAQVTLVIERRSQRGWTVRALGPALGGNAGRTIGRYDEANDALADAMVNGRQVEARGYSVKVVVEDRPQA